jgi:plastocyanin
MKTALWITLLGMVGSAGAMAGTITGEVTAHGPENPAAAAAGGAYASLKYKFAEKVDYGHLHDFVVYIDQTVPGAEGQLTEGAEVTQRNVDFDTHVGADHHVLPVIVGSRVAWPNADEVFHNVFSMSDPKEFNLGMYTKDEPMKDVTFDKVGRVDVFCAIHAKMHCIVLVLPSRCFAVTTGRGRYRIENVPAGTYPLKAWHERMPATTKTVTVSADGETTVDFVLGLTDLPTP